ncbi:hypothetical protein [Micromonospora chalcea]|uniref:hypothetical protein n=1 Tax=Micromonospora chalcea TaxID=1874 RepID=UPI003D70B813
MIDHHAVDGATVTAANTDSSEMYEGMLRSGRSFYFHLRDGRAVLRVEANDLDVQAATLVLSDPGRGIFAEPEYRTETFARLYRELVVQNWPGRTGPACWCPDAHRANRVAVAHCPTCAYGDGVDGLCPDRCHCCLAALDNGDMIRAGRAWIV